MHERREPEVYDLEEVEISEDELAEVSFAIDQAA